MASLRNGQQTFQHKPVMDGMYVFLLYIVFEIFFIVVHDILDPTHVTLTNGLLKPVSLSVLFAGRLEDG